MFVSQNEENNLGRNPETTLFEQPQAGCAESLNKLLKENPEIKMMILEPVIGSGGIIVPL